MNLTTKKKLCVCGTIIACFLLMASCTQTKPKITAGRDFPFERIGAIQRIITTKNYVEELLGPPSQITKISKNKERWRYYSQKECSHLLLLFITYKTDIDVHEAVITFDGQFVESVDKNSYTMTN